MMSTGEQIKRYRLNKGMTIKELSEKLTKESGVRISRNELSTWENDKRKPGPKKLYVLAKAIGITPYNLLKGEVL